MNDNNTDNHVKTIDDNQVEAEIVDTVEPSWKERLLSVEHWLRFAFMVLFIIILWVASYLVLALVMIQFVWALVSGQGNTNLKVFGGSLASFIHQVLRFLSYNTNDKPFPFADWPKSEGEQD